MIHFADHLLREYGYGVITVALALECAGLLVPGETIFFGSAIYASTTGHLNIVSIIAAAIAGAIIGNLIGFSLGRLGLHRIEAACVPENKPSHSLLLRAGFVLEGRASAYLKINGEWRDHLLFGLVATGGEAKTVGADHLGRPWTVIGRRTRHKPRLHAPRRRPFSVEPDVGRTGR